MRHSEPARVRAPQVEGLSVAVCGIIVAKAAR
jgi:hypothetical protein